MGIPVIINNRNLLTWPRAMVERLKTMQGIGQIVIIDNNSDYQPLLDWYKTVPCDIFRLKHNTGHRAPWDSGLVRALNAPYYVVTDPDLDLSELPDDTLLHLHEKLLDSGLPKIGLMLDLEAVTADMLYYNYLQWYEAGRRNRSPLINGVMTGLPVDTTFAIYPSTVRNYFVGGGSTVAPYQAKHLPWLYTAETLRADDEYMNYLNTCNPSASIKSFLNDKAWVKESPL